MLEITDKVLISYCIV